jgi:hypothetical protein
MQLRVENCCMLDRVVVRGRQVVALETGICTGVLVSNQWSTTRHLTRAPNVKLRGNQVTVNDIVYSAGPLRLTETWAFTALSDRVEWRIKRSYLTAGAMDDSYFPGWDFENMGTWTGAMLDNGGVAWNKYLESPNASFITHAGAVTFWNKQEANCLRVTAITETSAGHERMGLRFSHQPSNIHTAVFSLGQTDLRPRHNLRRYHPSRQDLWASLPVQPGKIEVCYSLQALDYEAAYDRGELAGLSEASIREVLNTIGRYGVIDRGIVGANGWRSGYACLHEQWFSQIGLALADAGYTANCAACYDFERAHAILPDGRVKSRWCYDPADAMPGTYDQLGFYEAQWGYLLDSQTCFPMCVAELFDLNGDVSWLRGQKEACERVLEYLLRRDRDGNGLVEMMTDSHQEQRGSDWIDIIWAAHENALVNAELYYALHLWTVLERQLGDEPRGLRYEQAAARLKSNFNKSTAEGGFWDSANQWYAYWRDRDGSIHGTNLVTPVNFAAIAYGVCDEPARQKTILDRIELETKKENLFFWPLNFFPYAPGEGHANNYPYPKYENGDIFLSWGELAIRAYAQTDPTTALKYIKRVLQKYDADGLSFQRYLRLSQQGAGDDILAGNCMAIVGLYRDLYGIQPKCNRLYLDPHLTSELDGTRLKYPLRDRLYEITLRTTGVSATVGRTTIRCGHDFGLNATKGGLDFFPNQQARPAMSVSHSGASQVTIEIQSWLPAGARRWNEMTSGDKTTVSHLLQGLQPSRAYRLYQGGKYTRSLHSDRSGHVSFRSPVAGQPVELEVAPE